MYLNPRPWPSSLAGLVTICVLVFITVKVHANNNRSLNIAVFRELPLVAPNLMDKIKLAAAKKQILIHFTTDLPAQRALTLAARGRYDGDLLRQPFAVQDIPQLLMVEVPLIHYEYWVWTAHHSPCPPSLAMLPQYKPIGLLGYKYFNFAYENSKVGFEQVTSAENLLKMLHKGRADYTIAQTNVARTLSIQSNTPLQRCFDQAFLSTYGYLYIHEQNRHLIPSLEKALAPLNVLNNKP